jgi:hypothetical protein
MEVYFDPQPASFEDWLNHTSSHSWERGPFKDNEPPRTHLFCDQMGRRMKQVKIDVPTFAYGYRDIIRNISAPAIRSSSSVESLPSKSTVETGNPALAIAFDRLMLFCLVLRTATPAVFAWIESRRVIIGCDTFRAPGEIGLVVRYAGIIAVNLSGNRLSHLQER